MHRKPWTFQTVVLVVFRLSAVMGFQSSQGHVLRVHTISSMAGTSRNCRRADKRELSAPASTLAPDEVGAVDFLFVGRACGAFRCLLSRVQVSVQARDSAVDPQLQPARQGEQAHFSLLDTTAPEALFKTMLDAS